MPQKVFRDCLVDFVAGLNACLTDFVASSRAGLRLLVWAVFVRIIYATIGLEGEGYCYLIGNNMLDNCCLMNVDILCLYVDIEMNGCFGNYIHVI